MENPLIIIVIGKPITFFLQLFCAAKLAYLYRFPFKKQIFKRKKVHLIIIATYKCMSFFGGRKFESNFSIFEILHVCMQHL